MRDASTSAGPEAMAFGASFRAPVSRRAVLKAGGAGLIGLGLSSLLTACGGSSGGGAASGTKTLTVGVYQEPDSLDPAATGLAMVSMMISHIFDPLFWWLPNEEGENEFYPFKD